MSKEAEYLAHSALESAFAQAIANLEAGMKSAASLADKESRLAESAREYFAGQIEARKIAISVIRRIHREYDEKKWALIKAAKP